MNAFWSSFQAFIYFEEAGSAASRKVQEFVGRTWKRKGEREKKKRRKERKGEKGERKKQTKKQQKETKKQ